MEEVIVLLERGRNEPCFCGSTLKYKKCCLKDSVIDDLVGITLHDDIPDAEYKDNRETISSEDSIILALFYQFIRNPESFDLSQQSGLFDSLHAVLGKYPNHPTIVSHLYNGYSVSGQKDKAEFFLSELMNRFTSYIHGRCICAQNALQQDNADQALAYLGNCHSLRDYAPHRTVFHMSEAINFHSILLDIYIYKEHEGFARRHYCNLVKIVSMSPQSGYDSYMKHAQQSIDQWHTLQMYRLIEKIAQTRMEYQNGKTVPEQL